jgi:hypothetical protein
MSELCVFCDRMTGVIPVHGKPVCVWCRAHLAKQSEVDGLRRVRDAALLLLAVREEYATIACAELASQFEILYAALDALEKQHDGP